MTDIQPPPAPGHNKPKKDSRLHHIIKFRKHPHLTFYPPGFFFKRLTKIHRVSKKSSPRYLIAFLSKYSHFDNTILQKASKNLLITNDATNMKKDGDVDPIKTVKSKFSNKRKWTNYLLFTFGASLTGYLSLDLVTGQWTAVLAGVVMLMLKLDSRYSFSAAMCLLLLVPIFLILGRTALADNYAVYSYYFLIFGIIATVSELNKPKSL